MSDAPPAPAVKFKAQLMLGSDIAIGPGKADLLAAIAQAGSISAAGRLMGLSYRRAWLLVDVMNRCFADPLVRTAHGGARGGGAELTPEGEAVLRLYRQWQAALDAASLEPAAALAARLREGGYADQS